MMEHVADAWVLIPDGEVKLVEELGLFNLDVYHADVQEPVFVVDDS